MKKWFNDSEARAYLCAFIRDQTSLKELEFEWNHISSSATEELLSTVLESGSIATIKTISLTSSTDLSSDRACTLLAQLIDKAPMLEKLIIRCLSYKREVRVALQINMSETGGEPGLIKVIDTKTQYVIVEMPTSRTKAVNFD